MKDMKKWMVALFGLFAFIAIASNTQTIITTPLVHQTESKAVEQTAFKGGEELVYKLYYNWGLVWISAGEVTFRVDDYGSSFHVSAEGRTYKSYDWAFKVRDYYECDITKENLLPEHSVRSVKEGSYFLYDELTYDQNNQKVVSKRGKTKSQTQQQSFQLKNQIHDVLSIIYYVRNTDFNTFRKDDVMPIEIFMDKKVWPLGIRYKGKESKVKVKGMGHFNTHRIIPEVITGDVFKEGDEMSVWVSDDANQIPVLIESPISVGTLKVVLKSYKGLKYPLSSKVK